MADGGDSVISCFYHPIERDPSLAELATYPWVGMPSAREWENLGFENRTCQTIRLRNRKPDVLRGSLSAGRPDLLWIVRF